MFENIGGKIKGLAKVICWIGIICCVIIGIIAISEDDGLAGVIIIVAGSLLSWVGSFVLYGFGELVENSSTIRSDLSQMKERTDR